MRKENTLSHIVTIKTEVRDPVALGIACDRLKLPPPQLGEHRLFQRSVTGLGVSLREWRYPVVCQCQTGQLFFDNFEGRWGQREELDKLLQAYAIEKARLEARKRGHSVIEQSLPDGAVKLTIEVGGAA